MDNQNVSAVGLSNAGGTALPAAVILRLLEQLGLSFSRGKLTQACDTVAQRDGDALPAEMMRKILAQAGLKDVQVAQLFWRRFDQRRLPALVRRDGLWYLAERSERGVIALTDAQGLVTQCPGEALQDAQVLWLRAQQSQQQARSMLTSLVRNENLAASIVWIELFKERSWITKVLVATLIINVLAVSTSIFAMQVYDRVVPTLAYATLATLVAGMTLILSMDWILKTLRARILDSVAAEVDKRVSQKVFDHLLHLQLDQQPRSLGTLAAQVGGLDSVRQFFSSAIVFGLVDLPFALLFIAFIAMLGGVVSWVYALLLPVALVLGYVTQNRLRGLLHKQITRHNERQGLLVDAIRGAESIRANNATWRFSDEWQSITGSISGYSIQQKAISNFSTVTTGTLSSLAYVGAVVVGVWEVEAGHLTMGGMIACSILGGRVIAPIAQAVQYMTQWQSVSQSLEMVNKVLSLSLERRPQQSLLVPEQAPDAIELTQIRFAYPESPVQQINIPTLSFKAGERVLLLGQVGCGKSTLLKVLAGLYRPSEGRVRLGDADLWEIDPQVVAGQVGYLPQLVHLFKGSLRSNLTLSGTTSDSRLLKVTRDLGIDAIADSSPMGMDLQLSEGGEGLSGGQRQLVALGRVVIAQPHIWLLDEPTASLDAESEARVWQVLLECVRPEDIFIVATHRPLLASKFATRVLVMNQGEIVKDGKPQIVLPQMMARRAAENPTVRSPQQQPGVGIHVV